MPDKSVTKVSYSWRKLDIFYKDGTNKKVDTTKNKYNSMKETQDAIKQEVYNGVSKDEVEFYIFILVVHERLLFKKKPFTRTEDYGKFYVDNTTEEVRKLW